MRNPAAILYWLPLVVLISARAEAQLVPFWDASQETWGFRDPNGVIAIPPRFIGAGEFRDGRAPIEDREGFAIIDTEGHVVERLPENSAFANVGPPPAPSEACAQRESTRFPSTALECYIDELGGSAPVAGSRIVRDPGPGEGSSSAVAMRLRLGVTVIERIGYEGFRRRVILPGVSGEEAAEWRQILYPDTASPSRSGCSESWTSGEVTGGAFIEQAAGC